MDSAGRRLRAGDMIQVVKIAFDDVPIFEKVARLDSTLKTVARAKQGEIMMYLGNQDENLGMLQVLVRGVTGWIYGYVVEKVR